MNILTVSAVQSIVAQTISSKWTNREQFATLASQLLKPNAVVPIGEIKIIIQ